MCASILPLTSKYHMILFFLFLASINRLGLPILILGNIFTSVVLVNYMNFYSYDAEYINNPDLMITNLWVFIVLFLSNIITILYKLTRLQKETKYINNKFLKLLYKLQFLYPIIGYVIIVQIITSSFTGAYMSYDRFYQDLDGKVQSLEKVEQQIDGTKIELRKFYPNESKVINKTVGPDNPLLKEILNIACLKQDESLKEIIIIVYEDTLIPKQIKISYGNDIKEFGKSLECFVEKPLSTYERFDFKYFSYVTFFGVGFGDFVPVSSFMKQLVMTEMFVGHFLNVIFIPILIGTLTNIMTFSGYNGKNKSQGA